VQDGEWIAGEELLEVEVLDGELVEYAVERVELPLPETARGRLPSWLPVPGVQTAVAAATGFVAGAATLALLRRYALTRVESPATVWGADHPRHDHGGEYPGNGYRHGQARTFVIHIRPLPQHPS
jgi:hypothetical protein